MKKLSSFIHESNKQDFTKKMLLNLDNGIIIEANISVKDLNESFAKSQISEKLLGKKILSFTLLKEDIEEEVYNNDIMESPEVEYYIPWTSIFDEAPYYQNEKIANAINDDEDVISTHNEKQYNWSNQPEVVVVKLQSDNERETIKKLTSKIQQALGTEYVRLMKKDW